MKLLLNTMLLFFLFSCQNTAPTIKTVVANANYLLKENGETEEFLSFYINYDDIDGSKTVKQLNIYHNESHSKWDFPIEYTDSSILIQSRVINDSPIMPRGQYVFEIVDAYGEIDSYGWYWEDIDKSILVYPSKENLPSISEQVLMLLYNSDTFVGSFTNLNEDLSSKNYTDSFYAYNSSTIKDTNILYQFNDE